MTEQTQRSSGQLKFPPCLLNPVLETEGGGEKVTGKVQKKIGQVKRIWGQQEKCTHNPYEEMKINRVKRASKGPNLNQHL